MIDEKLLLKFIRTKKEEFDLITKILKEVEKI